MKKNILGGLIFLGLLLFSLCGNSNCAWQVGATTSDVWHFGNGEGQESLAPMYEVICTKILCCVESSEMNACALGKVSSNCSKLVILPPCDAESSN